MKTMLCDRCSCGLYRTDGNNVRDLPDETHITPIVLVIQRKQYLFCTRNCASKWILNRPEQELRGGYPLF